MQAGAQSTATGSFVLKRLDFKVGEGEWTDTSMLANRNIVRLDELAAAYATLASGGRWRPLRLRADDPRPAPRTAARPAAAFQIFDALDDDAARAPAFGRGSALEAPFPMAAKTGTSTGWRDNWAIGVNTAITVAVWVGNFDGSPMWEVSGLSGAAPVWSAVMQVG